MTSCPYVIVIFSSQPDDNMKAIDLLPPKIQERSEAVTITQRRKQPQKESNDLTLISSFSQEQSTNVSTSLITDSALPLPLSLPLSLPPSPPPPLSLPLVELATLRPAASSALDASIYHFAVINAYFAEVIRTLISIVFFCCFLLSFLSFYFILFYFILFSIISYYNLFFNFFSFI